MSYDVRGWLKWFAAFAGIFPGIWMILIAFKKGKISEYYCPNCGKTEKLFDAKKYICSLCKVAYKKIEDLTDK